MKVITFYSYKGGVGRSLALANIATRLLAFNRSVCILDFDLEAPGIHMKFNKKINHSTSINVGIVDYIYDFVQNGIINDSILPFVVDMPSQGDSFLSIIPAGNAESNEYWKKLSCINWFNLVYENKNGIAFFLDLKEKIEKELNPDFLLIDSRTGISEMSGVTLSLLADEIVFVAANNLENLSGVKKIITSIEDPEKAILGKVPKMHFVLSRIPFSEKKGEDSREFSILKMLKKQFPSGFEDFHIIHSDREIEWSEHLKINYDGDDASSRVSKDYLKLFGSLTKDVLTKEEIERYEKLRLAERYFNRANEENVTPDQGIEFLNQAIQLNPSNPEYFFQRARLYLRKEDANLAYQDCMHLIKMNVSSFSLHLLLGNIYVVQKKFNEALESYRQAMEIYPKDPRSYLLMGILYSYNSDLENSFRCFTIAAELEPTSKSYNGIANYYRLKGNYNKALEFIYKAIELDPENEIAFATLAEINAGNGNKDEFYLNFERALRLAKDLKTLRHLESAINNETVYKQFENEDRFQRLLERYNIVYNLNERESVKLTDLDFKM